MSEDAKFVPVKFAAQVAGRSHHTIRTWAREGAIRTRPGRDSVEVHVNDATQVSKDRGRRNRKPRRLPE